MKTAKELRAELRDLDDEAKVLLALIKSDEKEATDDDLKRFEDLIRIDDDNPGLIQAKRKEVERREHVDAAKRNLAAQRMRDYDDLNLSLAANDEHARRVHARPRMARLRAFRGEHAERNAYNCGHWLKMLKGRSIGAIDKKSEDICNALGWGIQAAQSEGDASAGGYLVPEPLAATIVDNRENIGIARRVADVLPMSSETQNVPKVSSGLTVYAPGEGNSLTDSDAAYEQIKLVATKRGVLNYISSELSEDALVNMTDRAAMEMARALALQEDEELINGDGTSTYFGVTGLLSSLGAGGTYDAGGSTSSGSDTWPEIVIGDISATFGLLDSQYWVDGEMAILCSAQFYHSVLQRLQMAAGGNTIDTLGDGSMARQFMGHPVIFTSRMPTATAVSTVSMLFGNFRRGVMLGDRSGVRMGISLDYRFDRDQIAVRAISRYDIHVHEAGGASSAGAYVGLKTSAT